MVGSGFLAVAAVAVYIGGLMLLSDAPGACNEYNYCHSSPRDEWRWTAEPYSGFSVMFAVFLFTVAALTGPLRTNPTARKIITVLAIIGLAGIVFISGFLALIVANTECSADSFLCFGGPQAAAVFAAPGVVSAVTIWFLAWTMRPTRVTASTVASTVLAGLFAAAVVGAPVAGLLTAAADSIVG